MVNRNQIIAIVVVLVIVLGGILWLYPTDRRKIKKQFKALSEMALKEGEEQGLARAKPMVMAKGLFTDPCRLFYPARDLSGEFSAKQLGSYAAQARLNFRELTLDFYDMAIHFPEEGVAEVITTARLRGVTSQGEETNQTNEMDVTLRKIDGKWFFADFEIVEVLEK